MMMIKDLKTEVYDVLLAHTLIGYDKRSKNSWHDDLLLAYIYTLIGFLSDVLIQIRGRGFYLHIFYHVFFVHRKA